MKNFVFASILIVFFACSPKNTTQEEPQSQSVNALINSVTWIQNSGEFVALSVQTYQFAQQRLIQLLDEPSDKPKAIVLDIDETVIDNSPYEAFLLKGNATHSEENWIKWVEAAEAEPIPGALDFLNFTQQKGVEIFYVTNRSETEVQRAATFKNLQEKGFPYADNEHLVLKDAESSKESRRQKIAEKFNIILFFGDNLNDFSDFFYYPKDNQKTVQERVLERSDDFGSKFIVLPNPMYGEWENMLYKKNTNQELTRDQVKINSLRSFSN